MEVKDLVAGMAVNHSRLGPGTIVEVRKLSVDVAFWFVAPIVAMTTSNLEKVIITDKIKTLTS